MLSSVLVEFTLKFLPVSSSQKITMYERMTPFCRDVSGGFHLRVTDVDVTSRWLTPTGGPLGAKRQKYGKMCKVYS